MLAIHETPKGFLEFFGKRIPDFQNLPQFWGYGNPTVFECAVFCAVVFKNPRKIRVFLGGVESPILHWTILHYPEKIGKAWRNLEIHKTLCQNLLFFAKRRRRLPGRILGRFLAAFLAARGENVFTHPRRPPTLGPLKRLISYVHLMPQGNRRSIAKPFCYRCQRKRLG